jgi:subtilisin
MKYLLAAICALSLSIAAFGADKIPPVYSIPPNEVLPGVQAVAALANKDLGYGTKLSKFPEAWEKNSKSKGKGIKVAVLDTGCDVNHVWIKDNVRGTYNAINKSKNVADGNGHGTHCCGTVVECCPEVELYVVKVLSDGGSGSVVDIAHGIDYATRIFKVDVISMSIGGDQSDTFMPPEITKANAAGVIVLAAAGNAGPAQNTDGYPARYPECISIAACDVNSAIANFSSRGKSVFATFPGVDVWSAAPGNKKVAMSGTSMACPHAAAAAVVWCSTTSVEASKRPLAFRDALRMSCKHPTTRSTVDGYGISDVSKLVGDSTPEQPGKNGYDECMAAVKKGRVVTLNHDGFYDCEFSSYSRDSRLKHLVPGVYVCFLDMQTNTPMMIKVLPVAITAPAQSSQPRVFNPITPQPIFPRITQPSFGPGGCQQPAWSIPGFRFR